MKNKMWLYVMAMTLAVNARGEEISKAEMQKYMASCKAMMVESQPGKDPKDIEMLCRDPYLNGKANESKEDKARRLRLRGESASKKEKALDQFIDKKSAKDLEKPKSDDKVELDSYVKDCKKLVLESDPGRAPKDAEMLCRDPYLKGTYDESYDDQVRRKRLIKESDRAKEKVLDKFVPKAAPAESVGNGVR